MAWTFCTKQDVLDIVGTSEDKLKDFWSTIAEAFIRTHMGAKYLGNETEITEYYDGNDGDTLIVRNPPISSVSSITVDGVSMSTDNYLAYETSICLLNGYTFDAGKRNVVITYTSGENTVSDDVRIACAFMIQAIFEHYDSLGTRTSDIFADAELMGDVPPNVNIGLISHLQMIMRGLLRRYKIRVRR